MDYEDETNRLDKFIENDVYYKGYESNTDCEDNINNYYDYYNTMTAGPFGYLIRYARDSPDTGGYVAEEVGWLRWGKGNAVDGYIIYEIPEDTREEDILLHGAFSTFGSAYWRFNV